MGPFCRGVRRIQLLKADGHSIDPSGQMAYFERSQACNLRQRHDTLPRRIAFGLPCRIAQ